VPSRTITWSSASKTLILVMPLLQIASNVIIDHTIHHFNKINSTKCLLKGFQIKHFAQFRISRLNDGSQGPTQ
jgi:hypothetical protein